MARAAFTLVELLVTISIIAVLAAIAVPAITSTKQVVYQSQASAQLAQLAFAAKQYTADYDDTFPIAMYYGPDMSLVTWFGLQTGPEAFDLRGGLLSAYTRNALAKDLTFRAKPYLGDGRGFGYNYGYLGSDFHVTADYSSFPNCQNASTGSALSDPSGTIVFATSIYRDVSWEGGNDEEFDFGFIDPPSLWQGNPNVDFRHGSPPIIDPLSKTVRSEGRAVLVFCDGHSATKREAQVKDSNFTRDHSP
ncbi:MAG: type II secretion system protein [Fimbriimonadaceae bacterium]|nr:type II secretion system protein [Fimbriimonadaceae bacterium]QYK57139.1 MAG: type II secretion system protein [Fimbriimonadaceae bacterium]